MRVAKLTAVVLVLLCFASANAADATDERIDLQCEVYRLMATMGLLPDTRIPAACIIEDVDDPFGMSDPSAGLTKMVNGGSGSSTGGAVRFDAGATSTSSAKPTEDAGVGRPSSEVQGRPISRLIRRYVSASK